MLQKLFYSKKNCVLAVKLSLQNLLLCSNLLLKTLRSTTVSRFRHLVFPELAKCSVRRSPAALLTSSTVHFLTHYTTASPVPEISQLCLSNSLVEYQKTCTQLHCLLEAVLPLLLLLAAMCDVICCLLINFASYLQKAPSIFTPATSVRCALIFPNYSFKPHLTVMLGGGSSCRPIRLHLWKRKFNLHDLQFNCAQLKYYNLIGTFLK